MIKFRSFDSFVDDRCRRWTWNSRWQGMLLACNTSKNLDLSKYILQYSLRKIQMKYQAFYHPFEKCFISKRSFLPYVAENCLFFDSAQDVLNWTIVYWHLMTSYHCFLWIHFDSKYPPTTLMISKISFFCCLKNKTIILFVFTKLIFKKVWLNTMQSFSHDKKCKNFDEFCWKVSQE